MIAWGVENFSAKISLRRGVQIFFFTANQIQIIKADWEIEPNILQNTNIFVLVCVELEYFNVHEKKKEHLNG